MEQARKARRLAGGRKKVLGKRARLVAELKQRMVEIAVEVGKQTEREQGYVCGPHIEDGCKNDPEFSAIWTRLQGIGGAPDWRFIGGLLRQDRYQPFLENGVQKRLPIGSQGRDVRCWVAREEPSVAGGQ